MQDYDSSQFQNLSERNSINQVSEVQHVKLNEDIKAYNNIHTNSDMSIIGITKVVNLTTSPSMSAGFYVNNLQMGQLY